MTVVELQNEILNLKRKTDVTILAHYYQPIEIQEIADYLGDSLGLSRIAKEKADTKYITIRMKVKAHKALKKS